MNIWAVVPGISVFAYAILIGLALRHPRRRERRAFLLFLTAVALWSLTSFLLHIDDPSLLNYTLPLSKALLIIFAWVAVTYYHFVRVYVHKQAGPGVFWGAGFVLFLSLLAVLGWFPRAAHARGGLLFIDHGPGLYLLAAFALTIAAACAYALLGHYRQVTSPSAKNRTAYLIMGLAVITLGSLTNLNKSLVIYPFDHLSNLLNAVIISYAILRYQLLDIKVVLRHGLAYSAITIVLSASYLFLLFGFQSLLQRWTGYSSLMLALGLALLMAVLFAPLRNIAQDRVDRLFYRDTYHYRKMLLSFSSNITSVLNLEALAQNMLHPIIRAMKASWAALLIPDAESGDFRSQFVLGEKPPGPLQELRVMRDSPLVAWLRREGRVFPKELLDVIPEAKGLWQEERGGLETHQVELLCPILSRGELTGILTLGEKATGAYSQEEMELLTAIASGAAVALENASLLQSLKHHQLRLEKLLGQVVAAQEEERQRIAAEFHDGVAQWLVRASYQIQICSALLSRHQDKALEEELASIESTMDNSIKEMRRVLAGLRPPSLEELGLLPALRQELGNLQTQGVNCRLELQGEPVRLSPQVEIATYRIVQEALNNIRKHSGATGVLLQLLFRGQDMSIEIRDNGRGFNVARTLEGAVSAGRMGLLGMRERAWWLGGEFNITSREGAGTTVAIRLPIEFRKELGDQTWQPSV